MSEEKPTIDSEEFRLIASSSFLTGVTVISTRIDDKLYGLTANAVTSFSLDPPSLLACIAVTSDTGNQILISSAFGVSVLAEDQQSIAQMFASDKEDKFKSVQWHLGENGMPLISGSVATFECNLEHYTNVFDHWIFVGRISTLKFYPSRKPLCFYKSRYWTAILKSASPS